MRIPLRERRARLVEEPEQERLLRARRLLLHERGVTVIDLGPLFPAKNLTRSQRNRQALAWLLASLHNGQVLEPALEWPLQPAAQAVYGQAVTRVDHLGSFACRNVYSRENGRRSQHASADALDIAGFRLADGRSINVLKDWPKDNQDARFLRQVRDGACDLFSVVLSPDYNAAHRNHFHVDVGPWWVCR